MALFTLTTLANASPATIDQMAACAEVMTQYAEEPTTSLDAVRAVCDSLLPAACESGATDADGCYAAICAVVPNGEACPTIVRNPGIRLSIYASYLNQVTGVPVIEWQQTQIWSMGNATSRARQGQLIEWVAEVYPDESAPEELNQRNLLYAAMALVMQNPTNADDPDVPVTTQPLLDPTSPE